MAGRDLVRPVPAIQLDRRLAAQPAVDHCLLVGRINPWGHDAVEQLHRHAVRGVVPHRQRTLAVRRA